MIACTSFGLVPNVGGISEASTTPRRPLVPAPTKMMRPPFFRACVMISMPWAMRSFSFRTAVMTLRSSLTTISMMSRTGALSMARETGLMASVGSDCHFEVVGMNCPSAPFCRPGGPRVQPVTVLVVHEGVKRRRNIWDGGGAVKARAVHSQPMDVGRQRGDSVAGGELERVAEVAGRLERELAKAIIGQRRVVREILIAFLAGGHCLLRGVPGLAK